MDRGASPSQSGLLEEVVDRIGDTSGPLANFVRAYLHRIPLDTVLTPDQAYREVLGLFQIIALREGPISVRVFNPTEATHGYQSPGSVVEVHVDDAPFLVDSVSNELQAHGLSVVRVLHPVIGTVRDGSGRLLEVLRARDASRRESVQHYVLDRLLDPIDHASLTRRLESVLGDVLVAVRDFAPMVATMERMTALAEEGGSHYSEEEVGEAVAFLRWLTDDNFVFLGYREYRLVDTSEGPALEVVPDSGLGILSDSSRSRVPHHLPLSALAPPVRARYESGDLLVISKTNRLSTVHRRARMDYVAVRMLGPDGKTCGEARLLGLFTSKAYMESVTRIPVLRRKLNAIVSAEDLIEGSHDYKAVVGLIESYPKDELFGLPTEDLRRVVLGLLAMETRARVRLFVRRGLLDRSVRIMVAMPRDRYSADLRQGLEELFLERFGGVSCDYHLSMGEGEISRLHFVVWVPEGQIPEVGFEEMEAEVMALTRSWSERVTEVLAARRGAAAEEMVSRWARRLPRYYTTSTQLAVAAGDIERLDELVRGGSDLLVGIQNEVEGAEPLTRVALYRARGKQALSDLTPALEDMGLRVVEEVPTRLAGPEDLFIHDFGVVDPAGDQLDVDQSGERLARALTAVWERRAESDSLNRLILAAGLDYKQVAVLRAYHVYWRRVSPTFTVNYVHDALVRHPQISAGLVRLFESRFDPAGDGSDYDELRPRILDQLDSVPSLDEDRILRGFFRLIEATVRTNAYRADRASLAFKLRSSEVPDMPAPRPYVEVFVIAEGVEGVHLRAGPLARGGIRWSERREDYRTEVLGLMKAQVTKNAVIVPTGAKGGFVLRRPPSSPEEIEAAVRSAYEVFIRGLLDVTDTLVDGEVVHPEGVRAHDGPDPYLVVAADKGTARFSDLANRIAAEYRFWLGDAFASGGATGYDHKELGITAAGAWKSLETYFAVEGRDPRHDLFTVIGIGDMSGDVFGNGMLGSDTIELVAAFDHRHVFLDPDPDAAVSYRERKRLFSLPRSSWADYDPTLISEGGGVYSRSAKRIALSPAARRVLGTEIDSGTPAEVIRLILRAPVDVIWNGGIGTYVKSATESNEEVGDRSNDEVRINGSEVRARIVVEGGNLGFTQKGRIEYALDGGRINTDFIDNSGGVNCSDREVNLKILLGQAERAGEIDEAEGRDILAAEAVEVVEAILGDCLDQVQMLTIEEAASRERLDGYEQLMAWLEESGALDREMEALPSSQEMAERARSGGAMTRPELAVLSAYAKRSLTEAILASTLPDATEMIDELTACFPGGLTKRFGHLMWDHPLRRELVATMVANELVDHQGPVFATRLMARTGADASEVVWAYRSGRDLVGALQRGRAATELFGVVPYQVWTLLVGAVDRLVATLTRWYLRHGSGPTSHPKTATSGDFDRLVEEADGWGPPEWQQSRRERIADLEAMGVPLPVAHFTVVAPEMVHAPDILAVAGDTGLSPGEVGRLFHRIGASLGLDRLGATVVELRPSDPWQRWARETLEDDLLALRRHLAERILPTAGDVDEALDAFLISKTDSVARVIALVDSLEPGSVTDPAPVLVVMRQIEALVSG